MDGFEALKKLRQFDDTRTIPIVVVSARALSHEVEAGIAAGFNDYITKPISAERINRAVEKFLS